VTQQEPPDWFTELAQSSPSTQIHPSEREPLDGEVAPVRRRRRRNRRIAAIVATLVILGIVGTYVSLTLSAPVGAAAATIHRPGVVVPAAASIALPPDGEAAVSVAGADGFLGPTADGIFASSGGNGALPMASISKLITAMVVLSARPLGTSGAGPTITWDKADSALYDKYFALNATIAAMKLGSSMSEHDAIETMLVVSACNYAEAMADWAFGSDAGFASAAKKWLTAHGLSGTTMVEPTGLDARNTSTPSDLIAIGKLAMADPAIAAIVAKTSLDVPALAGMPSTNDLLGTDGIDGIKTGTLDTAGSDLLFSAVVPVARAASASATAPLTLTVTGVMLGGASHGSVDAAVRLLLASLNAGFHQVPLATKGEVVGSYSTAWGARASMTLSRSASVLTWSNTPVTSRIATTTLKTGASGETVGSVTWTAGKRSVTVPVVLRGRIQGPSAWWRLTHPLELKGR
jgi:serine-type D-Ala-D-Ala carboxypeptidase (penicillin-binding protein 5/6)